MLPIRTPKANVSILSRHDQILDGLSRVLRSGVVGDAAGLSAFESDAFTACRSAPLAVVLPRTTAEVSRILKFCNENHVKVAPRGAGTSLSGGAIALDGAVVICLSRMNRALDVNIVDRTATIEAGMAIFGVSDAAAHANFFYAPGPSSERIATIGGAVATNASGARSLKYGVTAANILKVKMVLMSGEIVELGGPYLDGQGYDLLGLVTGSEGQFGIVTEVTVRILRRAEESRPMLIGFSSAEAAGACAAAIIADGLPPVAIEFMDKTAIHVCEAFAKAGYPMDAEAMLIVEVEGSKAEIGEQAGRVAEIAGRFEAASLRTSRSEDESAAIWKGRNAALGALGRVGDFFCMDGVVPLGKMPAVLKQVEEAEKARQLKIATVCHAGDGKLTALVLYDANDERERQAALACGAHILKLYVDASGCLAGEHGVGLAKLDFMRYQHSEADLLQKMRVKAAFDPQRLLNPGKVFPLDLQEKFAVEAARRHA